MINNMAVNTFVFFLIPLIGSTLDLAFCLTIEGPFQNLINETEYILQKGDNATIFCYHENPITWLYPSNKVPITPSINYLQTARGFEAKIEIYDVDDPAVGFYTCVEKDNVATNISIYLYVEGATLLYVDVNQRMITGREYRPLLIPCKPTSPNIQVELYHDEVTILLNKTNPNGELWTMDRRNGFWWKNPEFFYGSIHSFDCLVVSPERNMTDRKQFNIEITKHYNFMHKPEIANGTSEDFFAEGYPLKLKCEVKYQLGRDIISLKWFKDDKEITDKRINTTDTIYQHQVVSSELSINHLEKAKDEGKYTCYANDSETNNSEDIDVKILPKGTHFIHIEEESDVYNITVDDNTTVIWGVHVRAFPRASIEWFNNQKEKIHSNGKYDISVEGSKHILKIPRVKVTDIGNYTIQATNKYGSNTSYFHLRVKSTPNIVVYVKPYNLVNYNNTISCSALGYPEPDIDVYFKYCQDDSCTFEKKTPHKDNPNPYTTKATINIKSNKSGFVKCIAHNSYGSKEEVKPFTVTDVESGFQIWAEENDEKIEVNEEQEIIKMAYNDEITLYCAVTKMNYTDGIEWYYNNIVKDDNIIKSYTDYSYKILYSKKNLTKADSGNYTCKVEHVNGSYERKSIQLNITAPQHPTIVDTNLNQPMDKLIYPESHKLYCIADGVPKPKVTWKKDGYDYTPDENRIKFENNSQTIHFFSTNIRDEGVYECTATNKVGISKRSTIVGFSNIEKTRPYVYVIIAILVLGILVVLIFLYIKMRKENELKRMLRSVGLEHFEKGQIESINPEIGIDDQAELLPYYKDHWEIPRENIKLGKQLGAGAFGIVIKAEVTGIKGEKEPRTVAVKMVKKNIDCSDLKALCSELKIMSHLGSHVNVVNLIGAFTGNIAKRELLVVVEFCRFGNLHNYLLRHRGNFINQIDPDLNVIDYNIGAELLERSFSVSSNQSQDSSGPKGMQDYRENSNNTAHTQYTTSTTVCMTPTGQDEPLSSNNSIQPQWRSNYKGDYKGKIKPICTKDLLTWIFQVARGMEYLASRKVLHGDLAARNILLADNNVVKICDFGLAKRMYKDDNYKKQNNSPLPIKWMAIESITDRVFSTQSDVWSFGIVMWEFFSLAKTPYPGMEADERLYYKLVSGYRMESPPYATPEIYEIMLDCWKSKPLSRPTFSKLAERIGNLLELAVLRHYVDLNDPYLQMNTTLFHELQSDYLQMASPPDFANLSTPQYVNHDSGISSPIPGQPYLLMKPAHIFSPRAVTDGEVFKFDDVRKDGQTSESMEMAPMLNLKDVDNLSKPNSPEPGEMPSYSNPTYKKMALINEGIVKTKDNYVNMPQNKNMSDFINADDKIKDGGHHYVNSVSRDWERDVIRA